MLVRLIMNTLKACVLAVLVGMAYVALAPAESDSERIVWTNPSPTPTYPVCVTEDGNGQALCMWQGSTRTVLSGDCALVTTVDRMQALCVEMHDTQQGSDKAQECNDLMPFESAKESDWEWLDKCYKNGK